MDGLQWQEYGIAGVVIAALFFLVWNINKTKEELSEKHTVERKEWAREHKDERREWKEDILRLSQDSNTRKERLERVMRELTKAIRELKDARRATTRGHVDPKPKPGRD